jgi:hypothetical protein
MITARSKVVLQAAEEYSITNKELVDIIELCVCDYYTITTDQLRSKSRRGEIPRAKKMFYMLTLSVIDTKAIRFSENLGQSHCMVTYAKKSLLELDKKWCEQLAKEYDAISSGIVHKIHLKAKPLSEATFLEELSKLMTEVMDSNTPDKSRLLTALDLIYTAEKKGQYDNIMSVMMKVVINNQESEINVEVLAEA